MAILAIPAGLLFVGNSVWIGSDPISDTLCNTKVIMRWVTPIKPTDPILNTKCRMNSGEAIAGRTDRQYFSRPASQ